MDIMTELDEILDKADYFEQLRYQKELLSINFQDACVMAYQGGIFQLTPEFISGTAIIAKDCTEIYVLDRNQSAILIKDPAAFIAAAIDNYRKAITEYGNALANLKNKRSARSIIES